MIKPLHPILRRVCYTLCGLALAGCSSARTVNRTIDNANGDSVTGRMPEYVPATGWAEGDLCTGCKAQPDRSKAHDQTWSDATHHPGDPDPRIVRLQFSGTAIYVYNIMANTIPYVDTLSNLTFNLDGTTVDSAYVHQPSLSTDYDYNVTVFSQKNLQDTDHVLEMQSVGDTKPSLILFDYAIYSVTEADPPPPPPPSTTTSFTVSSTSIPLTTSIGDRSPHHSPIPLGLIIGCAIGGTILVIAIALTVWLLRRRRARRPCSASTARLSSRPWFRAMHGIGVRGGLARGDSDKHWTSSESPPTFGHPTYPSPSPARDKPASASSPYSRPTSSTTLVAASAAARSDGPDAKREVDRDRDSEGVHVTPLLADAIAASHHGPEPAPQMPPTRWSEAFGSLEASSSYDDSRTEYTYVTQSDGSVSRLRGELVVLREEVQRLRRDQELLLGYRWDEAPPQYQ